MLTRCVFTLVVAWPAALAGQVPRWQVDSASVTFEIRNAGLPVRGSFDGLEAELCFDPERPETGRLTGSIDPATIQTGIGLRDRHLQRREYFDVEKYGAIELRSRRLWRTDAGYAGTFLLRIRDVEREIDIPFDFEPAGSRARISGSFALDRLDYGIGKRSLILGDEVIVRVALALARDRSPVSEGGCLPAFTYTTTALTHCPIRTRISPRKRLARRVLVSSRQGSASSWRSSGLASRPPTCARRTEWFTDSIATPISHLHGCSASSRTQLDSSGSARCPVCIGKTAYPYRPRRPSSLDRQRPVQPAS